MNIISIVLTFITIILICFRYNISIKRKNIAYLIKLRNNIYKNNYDNIFLLIEIIIHLIQPYPYIEIDWVIITLGLNIKYSLNAVFTGFSLTRMYTYLRISKYFNMYYAEDIRSISHIEISSIYKFLYRCNIRYRPFITIYTIFLFFFFIWSIWFVCYERFDINGIFAYTWNVFWLIVVTITTSKIN